MRPEGDEKENTEGGKRCDTCLTWTWLIRRRRRRRRQKSTSLLSHFYAETRGKTFLFRLRCLCPAWVSQPPKQDLFCPFPPRSLSLLFQPLLKSERPPPLPLPLLLSGSMAHKMDYAQIVPLGEEGRKKGRKPLLSTHTCFLTFHGRAEVPFLFFLSPPPLPSFLPLGRNEKTKRGETIICQTRRQFQSFI